MRRSCQGLNLRWPHIQKWPLCDALTVYRVSRFYLIKWTIFQPIYSTTHNMLWYLVEIHNRVSITPCSILNIHVSCIAHKHNNLCSLTSTVLYSFIFSYHACCPYWITVYRLLVGPIASVCQLAPNLLPLSFVCLLFLLFCHFAHSLVYNKHF